MELWTVKAGVFLFLLINAALDFRKREISIRSLAVFGAAGVGMNLYLRYQSIWLCMGGIGVGIFLLAAAFVTREAVGFGDGLILCVTGIYLGFWENFWLLLTGLSLCGAAMGVSLALRRIRRTARFPLVPFLLLAWIVRLCI